MTLITALPFSIIMLLFIVSLMKALTIDGEYYERNFAESSVPWSGKYWKDRLKRIVSYKNRASVEEFIQTTVKSAFEEMQQEFAQNGIETHIKPLEDPCRLGIAIKHDGVSNFMYGVELQPKTVTEFMVSAEKLTDV